MSHEKQGCIIVRKKKFIPEMVPYDKYYIPNRGLEMVHLGSER